MGDEKLLADNMVDIIRGVVREEINKTDSTILCQVKNIRSNNSADVIPVSDRSLILKNIPNMTKFDLSVGDYVYLYKINNQLDNSFVCYVLGKNNLEGDYSITKDPYGGTPQGDISEAVAAFTPVLALTGADLYLQNYSGLAAILEAGQASLEDVTVGIVIKQHSRSHARHLTRNEDGDRVPMPTLYKNKATSWRGMFLDQERNYYEFSLDSSGKIVVQHGTTKVAAADFANKHLMVHTGGTTAWHGVKYAFMGAKFRINETETQCSSNSLAFTGFTGDGTSYLSSDWEP